MAMLVFFALLKKKITGIKFPEKLKALSILYHEIGNRKRTKARIGYSLAW